MYNVLNTKMLTLRNALMCYNQVCITFVYCTLNPTLSNDFFQREDIIKLIKEICGEAHSELKMTSIETFVLCLSKRSLSTLHLFRLWYQVQGEAHGAGLCDRQLRECGSREL